MNETTTTENGVVPHTNSTYQTDPFARTEDASAPPETVTPEVAVAAAKPEIKLTSYIVLRLSGNSWIEAGQVQANGPKDARSQVAKQIFEGPQEQDTQTLVAVSARHWQPKTLRPAASWDIRED